MGSQARVAHARIWSEKQARPPLERGIECVERPLKERALASASKMAAPSADHRHTSVREGRLLGAPGRLAAPARSMESEVVVISDDEDEDEVQGAGAGWAYDDEELLDYEDELLEPVSSIQRVVVAEEAPGVA
ncbi:hypothetical protein NDU88_008458 [Pleurodeles waltl]|uniref:Uncharacterized protein n=1 Tax=Pleurodeles waltl TaxID=8319 RepID=A0AAV7QNM2_PLEWA|nr:hypothetical protein NDU88_008458 [Pleurodeles waltl]